MLQQQAREAIEVAALTPNLPAVTSAEVEIATLGPGSVDQGTAWGTPCAALCITNSTGDSTSKGQRTCRASCANLHRTAHGTAE